VAEVLGSAVALNLLFHIPLLWAVIITGLDVLLLLALQRFGMRTIEAIELVRSGQKPEELAKKFEPSAQTIRHWVRQDGRLLW